MKKIISLSLGFFVIAGLSGCGGKKPVIETQPEQTEEIEETNMKPQPIKQARTSGTHPKEVGWEQEDFS